MNGQFQSVLYLITSCNFYEKKNILPCLETYIYYILSNSKRTRRKAEKWLVTRILKGMLRFRSEEL